MQRLLLIILTVLFIAPSLFGAEADLNLALRRAQYLLNGTLPTDQQFSIFANSKASYDSAVRAFLNHDNFYDTTLRYHERIFGVGLRQEYLEDLLREDIDGKQNKFARISCERTTGKNARFRCFWESSNEKDGTAGGCPEAWEESASVFWYPGLVAWACPTVIDSCGTDLSRCFITYKDEDVARNSELGATEIFDSRFAVINSLSRQAAGLATVVVTENYPYTKILEPGLTAMDGAIAHFYRQNHHFKIDGLNLHPNVQKAAEQMPLTSARFQLIKTDNDGSSAGVLSSFGWLRRYEKNRTRAKELYERLLCRKFTSELPKVFPQDPGNLRETPGCSGCHSVLDPLADFFNVWGEGGDLYLGHKSPINTYFNNKRGSTLAELGEIIRTDQAFATCSVQHAWEWLMGRGFYADEDTLRSGLTEYFVNSNYSFKELVYAIATHPAFVSGQRGDGVVTDPLDAPPIGQMPGEVQRECNETIDYAAHIAPKTGLCTNCHNGTGGRQALGSEAQWRIWARQAVGMMASGQMPPGQFGPEIESFKENVRCWAEQQGL